MLKNNSDLATQLVKIRSASMHIGPIDADVTVASLLPEQAQPKLDQDDVPISIGCPISFKRRGVEMRMLVTNSADRHREPDAGLVQTIIRAHRYLALLVDGRDRTITDVALVESVEASEVRRILPLALPSPSIVDSILAGTQPISLKAQRLSRIPDLPASWQQQTELLAGG